MTICIQTNPDVYLPEAAAYEEHLGAAGIPVKRVEHPQDSRPGDTLIQFMGLSVRPLGNARILIHEYGSLSTPPFAPLKNQLKRMLNCQPHKRIFLNKAVQSGLNIRDKRPYIYRDMGVAKGFFDIERNAHPRYDGVYVGSLRKNVIGHLAALSRAGWRTAMVGRLTRNQQIDLTGAGVDCLGLQTQAEVIETLKDSRYGLNIVPDQAPFNRQTSTKALEYAAAGLPIVSTRYPWIESFAAQRGGVIWLDQLSEATLDATTPATVEDLRWSRVLERSRFVEFVTSPIT